jgi:hypothetical protein
MPLLCYLLGSDTPIPESESAMLGFGIRLSIQNLSLMPGLSGLERPLVRGLVFGMSSGLGCKP